jgi:hypothetical protein
MWPTYRLLQEGQLNFAGVIAEPTFRHAGEAAEIAIQRGVAQRGGDDVGVRRDHAGEPAAVRKSQQYDALGLLLTQGPVDRRGHRAGIHRRGMRHHVAQCVAKQEVADAFPRFLEADRQQTLQRRRILRIPGAAERRFVSGRHRYPCARRALAPV